MNTTLIEILNNENNVMDLILDAQHKIHEAVKSRDWFTLESNMSKMQDLSVQFIALEDTRDSIKKSDFNEEEHNMMKIIQSKLIKSKIANSALNDYVKISKGFVQNVLDNVVPSRRNVLYSRNGTLVKQQPVSVVLDKVF
ncbi:hypothetical protein [Treponema sp.]|uniref:hypothetical protein n=1 Tax=Treponema sp. TaxID=166 RepID=UPI00298E5E88|nr:hypothetical protein [Treponema sp.]